MFLLGLFSINLSAQDSCEGLEGSKGGQKAYKKAIEELKLGRYSEATKKLSEIVDDEPEYIAAWWLLADINSRFTNRNRVKSVAKKAYQEVINLCPSYQDYYAYYYLASIYMSDNQYGEAYNMYEAFLNAETDKIEEKHFNDAKEQSEWAKFFDDIYSNEVPFNPEKVAKMSSADWDEYLPIITLDNDYMYFTRRMEGGQVSGYTREDNRIERFCEAKRSNGISFDQGKVLPAPFNQQPNEGGAALTLDNKTMIYTRCKFIHVSGNRYFNCDLVELRKEAGIWVEVGPLGDGINSPESWESMPTISPDGQTLYFVSDRKEGNFGGLDIFMSRKDAEGQWQKAVNVGNTINSEGNEKSPFIHTDSKTLYFSSSSFRDEEKYHQGHRGIGGYDIFYSRMNDKNGWNSPKNIGYPINTEGDDLGFFVSLDGRYGFFASNRLNDNKNWDVYSFELYKEARPEQVLLLKGNLKDEETGEVLRDSKVEIKNMKTKEVKEIKVDIDGDYAIAMPVVSDYVVTVKKRDYVYVSKYISQKNRNLDQPIRLDFKLQQIQVGKQYNLDDLYYDTDSDMLTKESEDILQGFFEFLNENQGIRVEIQGHTDNIGSDDYNLDLSARRAKTVYNRLISMGISANRLSYKGYGESMPIADNNTEAGRQKNRRTVFIIKSK
ncbi:MAG: OmpA family protein [Bacteroidales bacterium]|nr:OmpA family protein [Bacteroidales bacterium]